MLNIILVGIVVIALFFVVLSFFVRIQRVNRKSKDKYTVLQMRVPRESEIGPIGAEHIFATLHGVQSDFSIWQKLMGYSSEHISFEIASINRVIKFYVAFPENLRNLIEGQIYAQYPDVEITECFDYSHYSVNSEKVYGIELGLMDTHMLPIKRYSQFSDSISGTPFDSLAGITASLVKFHDPEDKAWIQIVVTPLQNKWRSIFLKCMKIVNGGFLSKSSKLQSIYINAYTTRNYWLKIILFPLYIFFWFQSPKAVSKESGGSDIVETTSSNHEKESPLSASVDKVSRLLFDVNIRIVYIPKKATKALATVKLREIAASFKQFNLPHLNGFTIKNFYEGKNIVNNYRKRSVNDGMIMNNEELATLYHLPNLAVKTPTIYWISSKKLEPPSDVPVIEDSDEKITILGKTNFRGEHKMFGVRAIDRQRHLYMIGKTGMGKSTVLENMIYSDIMNGSGVGIIDPHGDLADAVLSFIPSNRINDVILIEPFDKENAVAFNMLENVDPALNSIVCSGLVGIFKKIYGESWGPRLEHILRNTIFALLEYPGSTMLGVIRILQDTKYRKKVVSKISDPVVKSFWVNEFEKMPDRQRVEAISPIQNKVGQFLSSSTIRNIVGQPKSSIDLRFAMDKGKIVIVNLSKGKMGEDNSALLGSMFITKFQLDAMSRADIPQNQRKDFYLYVDEFQNFATDAFATILSEARKYRLNLTMANQYIAQMPDEVRDAVFGNVGSLFSFQVGFDDAEVVSQQFGEEVLPSDIVSLSKYTAYMRLLIDGMPSKTFSLSTLPPPVPNSDSVELDKIRRVSNERYAKKVSVISDKIKRWSENDDEKRDFSKDNIKVKKLDNEKNN